MTINGETKLIGFLGSTYKTSKMYAVYNAAFEALGLNYAYVPLAAPAGDLAKTVEGIRALGIHAVGVTIPYKIEIIPYLDELDEDAKRVGAVAVVVNRNGRLIGGTTDGKGALKALREKTELRGKNAILIGAGGAARAIAFSLLDAGASVVVLNRTEEIAMAVSLAGALGCPFGDLSELEAHIAKADLVINTTPVGMSGPLEGKSLVKPELLRPGMTVMDIVTKPKDTALLKDAARAGCSVVYGDRMLLWQAVYKFQMYTGVEAPVEVMEQAMR